MNTKEILILVLTGALVLSLIFRPSKEVNNYGDEIKNLKQQNELLFGDNDSLNSRNVVLSQEIKNILIIIDSTEAKLADTEIKLNRLRNEKNKISNRVRVLNADGVASKLSDYLNKQ